MSLDVMAATENFVQGGTGSVSPAFNVRRRTASDATWRHRPRIVLELNEGDIGIGTAFCRVDRSHLLRLATELRDPDTSVAAIHAGAKLQPVSVAQLGSCRAAAAGGSWSLTLVKESSGRPAEWSVVAAKLAAEFGDRQDVVERTIHGTIQAHMSTNKYSTEVLQRGFQLYRAINDANGKQNVSEMLKSMGPPDPKKMLSFFLENMASTIKRVVAFTNLLPGFSELEKDDRVSLLKQGSFEIILSRYARLFTEEGMFTPDMTVLIPRNAMHKMPLGELFVEQHEYAGVFNRLELTDSEIGLVCAIMICNPDRLGLRDSSAVEELQKLYLQCFYVYLKTKHPDDHEALFSRVLEVLPLCAAVNESHARTMNELKQSGDDDLQFPDLHNEIFE